MPSVKLLLMLGATESEREKENRDAKNVIALFSFMDDDQQGSADSGCQSGLSKQRHLEC